jgi:hypothetical protein
MEHARIKEFAVGVALSCLRDFDNLRQKLDGANL